MSQQMSVRPTLLVTRLGKVYKSVFLAEVVQFSLNIPGVSYVVGTKFNQDPIENFFWKMRQRRGAYGALTCSEFQQNFASTSFCHTHALKVIRRLKRNSASLDELDPDLILPSKRKSKEGTTTDSTMK